MTQDRWRTNFPIMNDGQALNNFKSTHHTALQYQLNFKAPKSLRRRLWYDFGFRNQRHLFGLKQKPSLLRLAIGGPTYITNDYVPLDWNHSYEIIVSKIERQTIVFSTNQCLIWGYSICQKAKYFCEIDGKIEFINNEVTFNEAKKDCRLSNGHLSKKLVSHSKGMV